MHDHDHLILSLLHGMNANPTHTLPVVYVQRPTCPACGWLQFRVNTTREHADGARTQYAAYRRCSTRFRVYGW